MSKSSISLRFRRGKRRKIAVRMLKALPALASCFTKEKLLDRLGAFAAAVGDGLEALNIEMSYDDCVKLMRGLKSLRVPSELSSMFHDVLLSSNGVCCYVDTGRQRVFAGSLSGIQFAWISFEGRTDCDVWYDPSVSYDDAVQAVSAGVWKRASKHGMLRVGMVVHEGETSFRIVPASESKAEELLYASELVSEKIASFNRAMELGMGRSFVMHGPPGTGKSVAAELILRGLMLRTLKVSVADSVNIDPGTIASLIQLLKPEAILIDDMDRMRDYTKMFDTLQYYNAELKLLIATMNDVESIDPALLRPGRFDEIARVDRIDEAIVRKCIDTSVPHYDEAKLWPISYVKEYAKRIRLYGIDTVEEQFSELSKRVESNTRVRVPDRRVVSMLNDGDESR